MVLNVKILPGVYELWVSINLSFSDGKYNERNVE